MDWILVASAIVVLLIVTLIYVLTRGRTGGPRLQQLPAASRRPYAERWRVIETRVIDLPQEALQEADQLAVSILSERGAQMHHDRVLPRRLRQARRASQGRRSDPVLAMQRYQAIVDDACGRELREAAEHGRPEIA